jgi:cystathionine gamma-synthase/cystathionine gamma-lyase
MRLVDLKSVAALSKLKNTILVVDNTFASPYFQQPLQHGADIVVHSTTKYIGGHSDVVGGVVITNNETLYTAIKFYQNAAGGVPGAFDAWLTLRGVKTLALRMKQHASNAQALAEWLTQHPRVNVVHYPGLKTHPQHELAKSQMCGFSGMITFELNGGFEETNAVLTRLKLFSLAESLGGVESLVCYPARMTHGAIPEEERRKRGFTDGLIRLSVGIEALDDLQADLEQALTI